ncbi:MAG TPA: zinc ABC transporter substrate-binding protein [Candidatus Lokiarchaeia archaeon]|nr:zinc ABC transporter substrate-binding protein [Candidatus Lokiarchaeia archaeon]
MRKRTAIILIVIIAAGAGVGIWAGVTYNVNNAFCSASAPIKIVAAENFWGSLVSQLGGSQVEVLSIVTDPNADPHEYESNTANARAFSCANLVIVNGAGYDSWALQLISAGNNPGQTVLNVQELVGQAIGANPHFWYNPAFVNETVNAMYNDLVAIDPANATYFTQQYVALNASLGPYIQKIAAIKNQYANVKVASTESIFVYLANATGLDLISPPDFMDAISEGNDPAASDVATFQNQLTSHSVQILVYNNQTVTPITTQMQNLAKSNNIPVVGISETVVPPNTQFQDWMFAELVSIQNAL